MTDSSTGPQHDHIPPEDPPPPSPIGREKPLRESSWTPPGEPEAAPARDDSPASDVNFDQPGGPPARRAIPDETPLAWGGDEPSPEPPPPEPPTPPATAPYDPFARYPLRYGVLYPDRLSRWKTALRLPLLLPVGLFMVLVEYAQAMLFAIGWTAVFWRKKYPSWAFKGGTGMLDYTARATAYALLQTDKFPSFDREASLVRLDFADPPNGQLSRWRVVWWKSTLLIPHLVVLSVLRLALFVVTILAWFGIVATGNYPRGMFAFANGVMRWHYRVIAYFASFNDRYPPYSLSDEAGPAGKGVTVWSGVGGFGAAAGFVALTIVGVIVSNQSHTEQVEYAALQQGRDPSVYTYDTLNGRIFVRLQQVHDPGESLIAILKPTPTERVVVFEWQIANFSGSRQDVGDGAIDFTVSLPDSSGPRKREYGSEIVTVGNRSAPMGIASGSSVTMQAVFVVPREGDPIRLEFHNSFSGSSSVLAYEFR